MCVSGPQSSVRVPPSSSVTTTTGATAALRRRVVTGNLEDGSMSGAMRKIGEYLGLLEDTGVYDDEYDEQGYAEPETHQQPRRTPAKAQPAPVADISQRRRTPAPAGSAAGVVELARITTL